MVQVFGAGTHCVLKEHYTAGSNDRYTVYIEYCAQNYCYMRLQTINLLF